MQQAKILGAAAIAALLISTAAVLANDIVITGGRVIDPETGLDAIRNVAITGDKIVAISEFPLEGALCSDGAGSKWLLGGRAPVRSPRNSISREYLVPQADPGETQPSGGTSHAALASSTTNFISAASYGTALRISRIPRPGDAGPG